MVQIALDLSKPYYLVEIYAKSTTNLKFRWSTDNLFPIGNLKTSQSQARPKTPSETTLTGIYVDSCLEPPMNSCVIKILNNSNETIGLETGDTIKIYFGYYKKGDPLEPTYSLVFTGTILELNIKINEIILNGLSKIHKLITHTLEQSFSKIMSIDEIISKLVAHIDGFKFAKNGIAKATISKQKGYALSKQMSVYEHIKCLAECAGFDIYMDVNDKFNAKPWEPNQLEAPSNDDMGEIPNYGWLTVRDEAEQDHSWSYLHRLQNGSGIIDIHMTKSEPSIAELEIMNVQVFSANQYTYSISPSRSFILGKNGFDQLMKIGSINSRSPMRKYLLSWFSKGDLHKIARNLYSKYNSGITGVIDAIGSPQIRLCDGIKIEIMEFEQVSVKDTIFKVIKIEHIFNMVEGYITKIGVDEYVPKSSKSDIVNLDFLR